MLRPSWCGMRLCRGGEDEPGGRSGSDTDDRDISISGCHPSAGACTAGEVDLYVKACQHYIDGATNDANAIIEARNKAVKKAQEAVDVYNRFFDK